MERYPLLDTTLEKLSVPEVTSEKLQIWVLLYSQKVTKCKAS